MRGRDNICWNCKMVEMHKKHNYCRCDTCKSLKDKWGIVRDCTVCRDCGIKIKRKEVVVNRCPICGRIEWRGNWVWEDEYLFFELLNFYKAQYVKKTCVNC